MEAFFWEDFFFNFYWSIVDLQCCVSFRCTAKWIIYTYAYIHSFLDSFPIEAITEYWVEFPVLYSRYLLVIYFIYSSVYMPIPIFQFILQTHKLKLFFFFKLKLLIDHLCSANLFEKQWNYKLLEQNVHKSKFEVHS